MASPGRAILSYERALLLEPNHPEAQANLALVRSQAGAKALPAFALDAALLPLSPPTYVLAATIAFWLALYAFVGLLLWRQARLAFAALLLASLLVTSYASLALWRDFSRRALAIVTVPEATARLEAADRAGVAEALPAGSAVRLLSEHGAWVYAELPGGGRGWLPAKSVERLTPSDAAL